MTLGHGRFLLFHVRPQKLAFTMKNLYNMSSQRHKRQKKRGGFDRNIIL